MEAEKYLLIILAIALTVFLIIAIAIAVYVLKIVKSIKAMSTQAEMAASNFESFSQIVRKFATPTAISGVAGAFLKKYLSKDKEK